MFYKPHDQVFAPHSDEMITKQEYKDECDINTILKQYQQTGIITHVNNNRPTYEDLPDHLDYQTSLNILMEAETVFEGLPSKVRDHFQNDPGKFLAAFSDETQIDKLREFGLLKAAPEGRLPQPPVGETLPSGPASGAVPQTAPEPAPAPQGPGGRSNRPS